MSIATLLLRFRGFRNVPEVLVVGFRASQMRAVDLENIKVYEAPLQPYHLSPGVSSGDYLTQKVAEQPLLSSVRTCLVFVVFVRGGHTVQYLSC